MNLYSRINGRCASRISPKFIDAKFIDAKFMSPGQKCVTARDGRDSRLSTYKFADSRTLTPRALFLKNTMKYYWNAINALNNVHNNYVLNGIVNTEYVHMWYRELKSN